MLMAELNPKARKALHGALSDHLKTIKKKVRHMRAKKIAGEDIDGEETVEEQPKPKDDGTFRTHPTDMIEDDVEEEANETPETMEYEEETGLETPEEHTRAEREAFFQKKKVPKVGKVKSSMGRAMNKEEKHFKKTNKKERNPSVVQPQSQKSSSLARMQNVRGGMKA